ncbi:hypothetical protein RFI_37899, partial [Reticulomyxa filosa]
LSIIAKSITCGAFLNDKLFIPKAIWAQNKVLVSKYDQKLDTFHVVAKCLENTFGDETDFSWLQQNIPQNNDFFLKKIDDCQSTLLQVSTILEMYAQKSARKCKQKGVGKLWESLKDKSHGKVYDNSTYRELVKQICSYGSKIEMCYTYLSSQNDTALLAKLEVVISLMLVFVGVVFADMKEFLKVYLKRGAKNLYE